MNPLEAFLARYGLLALFCLATVEGDVSLVVAGVLAHLGILSLPGAMLAGALGNLVGDSAWFWLGRHQAGRIRASRVYQAVGPRIERLARRIGPAQLLAARVVYGTRNASMVFWGQYGLGLVRFLAIDALGCGLAAVGFTALGFGLGLGTAAITAEVKRVEHWLLVAVVGGGVLVAVISRLTRRRLDG